MGRHIQHAGQLTICATSLTGDEGYSLSGPIGLRAIKGFRDEALQGQWKRFRSSRLGLQYRVIYQVEEHEIRVMDITPHDYRKR